MEISIRHLQKAKKENVIRLAKWLKINTEDLSYEEIIDLVYWTMKLESLKNESNRRSI